MFQSNTDDYFSNPIEYRIFKIIIIRIDYSTKAKLCQHSKKQITNERNEIYVN